MVCGFLGTVIRLECLLFHGLGTGFVHAHALGGSFVCGERRLGHIYLTREFAIVNSRKQLACADGVTLIHQHFRQTFLDARADGRPDPRFESSRSHDFAHHDRRFDFKRFHRHGCELYRGRYRACRRPDEQPLPRRAPPTVRPNLPGAYAPVWGIKMPVARLKAAAATW